MGKIKATILNRSDASGFDNFKVKVYNAIFQVYDRAFGNCQLVSIGNFINLLSEIHQKKVLLSNAIKSVQEVTNSTIRPLIVVDIREQYLYMVEASDMIIKVKKRYTSTNGSKMIMLWLKLPE